MSQESAAEKPTPRESVDKQQTSEKRSEQKTVMDTILGGEAKIAFLADSMEERDGWRGRSYTYKLIVPHLVNKGEEWITTLTAWFPASYTRDHVYENKSDMQITILTGQGEMLLTKDKSKANRVYAEMQRQVVEKNAKKEE